MDEHELRTVLGHEAGHILSDHVLYRTALLILLQIGVGPLMRLPFFAGLPLLAIQLALLEWFRAAELSCDRAATLVNRSPMTTCQTMMVMAGGAASRKLSLDAFVKQANEYVDWEPGWDKLDALQPRADADASRTRSGACSELMKWVRSGDYDRIMAGEYRKRGAKADAARGGRRRGRATTPTSSGRSSRRPATASARPATRPATPPTSSRTGSSRGRPAAPAWRSDSPARCGSPASRRASACAASSTPSATAMHAERVGELDDRGDDRAVVAALDDAVDEGLVDLDHVDRQQVLEVRERGVADAEVVDRELHAERLEPLQHARARPPGPP